MPAKFSLTILQLLVLLCSCSAEQEPAAALPDAAAPQTSVAAGEPFIPEIDDCNDSAGMTYLCGVVNGEDILRLGNSDWLLVSGMDGSLSGSLTPGRIHLVNARERSVEILFPGTNSVFQHDRESYGQCPGPLDASSFSAHGLALQKTAKGPEIYRLYMTSHGAREAIEVFEVDAFLKPTIKWLGCIPMPASSWTNSVAILDDGGFVATQFFNPAEHSIDNVLAGEITGHVFEWHPGGSPTVIEGTEISGANGIAVSDDGRWIFVAAFGTGELLRFDRSSTPPGRESVKLDIIPDNVRWSDSGTLLVAGNNAPGSCGAADCAPGWGVVEVTPYNLEARRIVSAGEDSALHDPSSALRVNDEIWVGTYSGDRLAIVPLE